MPNNGYFDTVFAVDGDTTAVPDATQMDGSVSYEQGFPVAYSTPVGSGGKNFPRYQHNQILKDITAAVQNWQQNTVAPFITTSMNGGTPFSYSQYNMVLSGGVGYVSLVNSNTDTPPSAKWATINLNGAAFYSGGVTTGTASNQVLSTVVPGGYALVDGVTVACTAGFNCPGACNAAVAGTASTAVKIWNGTAYADPAASQFLLDETIFLSYNATHAVYVLTDAPTLGTAAAKAASNNSDSTVASLTGSFAVGHTAGFADTAGTVKDLGPPNVYDASPSNPTAISSATPLMLGLSGALTPNSSGVIELTITGSTIISNVSTIATVQLSYGTGSAPGNAASLTGTQVGSKLETSNASAYNTPFSATAIISGLTPGTAYWLDLAVGVASGSVTVLVPHISAKELR